MQQLDAEVASWRAHVFSEATKSTYSSHLRAFLRFCAEFSLTPCPAPTSTLLRYAAFLARSKCYTSVTQYLVSPKAPLMPKHLSQIRDMLRLDRLADLQFWAATLCTFFGLLRIGNLTPPHSVTHRDLSVTKKGIILYIRRSKTIQFGERTHSVVLPYLPGSHLCPVSTLLRFLGRTTSCPLDAPLFSIMDTAGRMVPLSAGAFRQRLQRVTSSCPEIPQCSTHSLPKVEQPGSCLAMSRWPMCASSGTGAVTQCFDIYCPMRLPNSKFFMVRLNCYNFENFAISWSICLGQCFHHAQFCADLICPIINYHNTSTLLSYSFMGWGFLI